MEDCESLFTRVLNKKGVAEKYLVRRPPEMQDTLNRNDLRAVVWVRGPVDCVDGQANHKADMAPLLTLAKNGSVSPERSRSVNRAFRHPINERLETSDAVWMRYILRLPLLFSLFFSLRFSFVSA